jgi:hypothetical protein
MELKQTFKVVAVEPKFNSEEFFLEPVNPEGKYVQELPGHSIKLINGNAAKLNALKVDALVEVTIATRELTELEKKEEANPSEEIKNVEDTQGNLAANEPTGPLDSTIVDEDELSDEELDEATKPEAEK